MAWVHHDAAWRDAKAAKSKYSQKRKCYKKDLSDCRRLSLAAARKRKEAFALTAYSKRVCQKAKSGYVEIPKLRQQLKGKQAQAIWRERYKKWTPRCSKHG